MKRMLLEIADFAIETNNNSLLDILRKENIVIFHYAIIHKNMKVLSHFLKFDLVSKNDCYGDLISTLCCDGDDFIFEALKNKFGHYDFDRSHLQQAISHGNIEMVKKLIENGVDIKDTCNAFNYRSHSMVYKALGLKHYKIAKYLIDQGADVSWFGLYDFHLVLGEYIEGEEKISKIKNIINKLSEIK